MKSPIDLINKRYKSLRKSEKQVAIYVLEHTDKVVSLSLQGLAKKCLISDATALRFCRSLGYLGFADFKASLIPELLRKEYKLHHEVDPTQNSSTIKNVFLQNFQKQLDSTIRSCDYNVIRTISHRIATAGKNIILGLGGSAGVAHIFSDSLGGLGIYSTCLRDRSIIQNLVATLDEQDVIIGISHSGETTEIVNAFKMASEIGLFTVGITNFSPSLLTETAKVSLVTSVPISLLDGYSCQARISQLALLELILFEISEELGKNRSNENTRENGK